MQEEDKRFHEQASHGPSSYREAMLFIASTAPLASSLAMKAYDLCDSLFHHP
jgi:hypothetical protein